MPTGSRWARSPDRRAAAACSHHRRPRGHQSSGNMSRSIRKFRTDKSVRVTKGSFDSPNPCKRLVSSRLHELHERLLPVSNLSIRNFRFFLLLYPGSERDRRRLTGHQPTRTRPRAQLTPALSGGH